MNEVFLDSSFAIALAAASDLHHQRALELAKELEANRTRLVTTRAVLCEIGNALSKLRYREAAVEQLSALEQDPAVEIVPLTEQLYWRAFELFRDRRDKEWGLIDCISFVVMSDRGVSDALTADAHFRQAGFSSLL